MPTTPAARRLLLGLAATVALQASPAHAEAPARATHAPALQLPFAHERLQVLAALQLTPAQTLQLLDILADAAALRQEIQAGVDAALVAADAELASPDADLAAMALASEAAVDARLAEARALRDRLIDFYTYALDAEQQALVRTLLRDRLHDLSRLRSALAQLRTALAHP